MSYDSDIAEEKIIEENEGSSLLLIPRSTFCNEKNKSFTEAAIGVYVIEVLYGYVDRKGKDGEWHEFNTIQVKYLHGMNEEVRIPIIPELCMLCHIAYRFKYASRSMIGDSYQGDIHYVPLDNFDPLGEPEPRFIRLPVENFAPHPWTEAKYIIRVHDYVPTEEGDQVLPILFPGKIKYIWYGFTDMTEQEFLERQGQIPWRNVFGDFKEEGVISVVNDQHHLAQLVTEDKSSKGFFLMREAWIRVPDSNINLVWKIGFDRFEGKGTEPSVWNGYHESQTFYYRK